MKQLTKVQYIRSIHVDSGNTVITIENAAQIIVNGEVEFICGIAYTNGTIIKGLIDPDNISD